MAKTIAYWATTGLLALFIGWGGYAEFTHQPGNVGGMQVLGYPLYFLTIVGLWKMLGAVAIVVPGLPRVKEWAYAGIFCTVTGAAWSHIAMADYGAGAFHVVINVVFAALAAASWALRPQSRVVGELFPRDARVTALIGTARSEARA